MAKAGESGSGARKPRAPRTRAARPTPPRAAAEAAADAVPREAAEAPDAVPREAAEAPDAVPQETAEAGAQDAAEAPAAPEASEASEAPAVAPDDVAPAAPTAKATPRKPAPRKPTARKTTSKTATSTKAAARKPAPRKPAPAAAPPTASDDAAATATVDATVTAPDDARGGAQDAPEDPAETPAETSPPTPVPAAPAPAVPAPAVPAPAVPAVPASAGPAKVGLGAKSGGESGGKAGAKAGRALPEEIGGYRILSALGRGGMGAVYRARDGDGRTVALKLLHAHLDDPEARERLTREVASLQKVRHAGVARVLDAEIDSTEAFVVTELVAGRDLGKHVKRSGALPPDQLLVLATRLREALAVVHAAGVLHRDLTPGNVMVTADGPVLIDFGLAQAVDDARVTSTGLVTGTPGYVSPDLLDGDAPTEASDWWGWAAVLTFAATGRPPFGKGTIGTVLTRVRAGEPDLAGLPAPVAQVLRSALAVVPADRATPDDVVAALEAAASATDDAEVPEEGEAPEAPEDAGEGTDDAAGETVVVTVVAPAEDPSADDWVHDGGTTVMPTGTTEVWATEDDEAYAQAYDQAYDPTTDDAAVVVDEGYDDADGEYDDAEVYDEYDEYDDEAYEDELAPLVDVPPPAPRRTGTVAALALPFLALGLARPGAAFVAALVVAALLRSVELDAEALERRRARRGARPSDRLRAVLTWPWYLVRGALGVMPVLVVGGAVVVLVGGVLWWLVEAGHWTVAPLVPGVASGLLRGNLPWVGRAWVGVVAAVGLAMVWFGPMARAHRDGARRVLAKAAPGLRGSLAAVVVGVVVAALLADAMLGQDVVWWPLGGPPDIG